jgi:L-alanine-DL-glutamate epimerase-like enolase superfamily enzyme
MALLNGIEFIPHAFKSGILMSATVQMLAAYKGDPLLEYCCQETVLSKKLLKKHFEIDKDGYVAVPNTPGLGVEIDLDSLEEYRVNN